MDYGFYKAILPVHLGTTTWLGCTKFAIMVSGAGTVTTVSLSRHLCASSFAIVIRCCCLRFLILHSFGVRGIPSSPRILLSSSESIDIELNKDEAIDREVAAEAEGALTPMPMALFTKSKISRNINNMDFFVHCVKLCFLFIKLACIRAENILHIL